MAKNSVSSTGCSKRGPKTSDGRKRARANLRAPWPAGQSGNPKGRRSAGATLREHINAFSDSGATAAQLRKVLRDPKAPVLKRTAAERLLRTIMPSLADYEGLVNGKKTLADLERDGIDTAVVKRLKERREYDVEGNVSGVTREIELHNLAGEEFDRISDRTDGRPTARLEVKDDRDVIKPADGEAEMDKLILELTRALGTTAPACG